MLTNVLKSLVARADVYDPQTGEALHPLLVRREEKTTLLIVVSGEKGLAGAFNSNILKAAAKFIDIKKDRNIDILSVGRKSRDYFRRRYPLSIEKSDARKGPIQIVGEYVGLMNRAQFASAREIAERVTHLYTEGKVDSVYIVYNEFKSVIAQRLVVDDVLPIRAIGEQVHEMTEETRKSSSSSGWKRRSMPGLASEELIPQKWTRRLRNLARRRWITFTSSRRKCCSATCCRDTFPCSCSGPCWSLKPPSMQRA